MVPLTQDSNALLLVDRLSRYLLQLCAILESHTAVPKILLVIADDIIERLLFWVHYVIHQLHTSVGAEGGGHDVTQVDLGR